MAKKETNVIEIFFLFLLGYGSGINAPGIIAILCLSCLETIVEIITKMIETGKYGPGTYTYQSGHNLILAHARAYRLYESEFKPTQQGSL
jgi:hypothetical protein